MLRAMTEHSRRTGDQRRARKANQGRCGDMWVKERMGRRGWLTPEGKCKARVLGPDSSASRRDAQASACSWIMLLGNFTPQIGHGTPPLRTFERGMP